MTLMDTEITSDQTETNTDSESIDLTPDQDGGVLKVIKRPGEGDDHPATGNLVSVHYVGTLTDGEQFDSSRDRGDKFEFTLGTGQVIKAWDLGVASMKKGELAVLTATAKYAYGERGSPPKIPPNATLVFEVELFSWKGEDLSPDEDGSITRCLLEVGAGKGPSEDAVVKAHLTGTYNGSTFDDRDVEFILGEGSTQDICEGIEIALKKFKNGETSKIKIASKFAFGADGKADFNIPGGADVEYIIKLISFEKAKESWEMEKEEKSEQAEISKSKGTTYFKAGNYTLAVKYYSNIAKYLEYGDETDPESKQKRDALMLAGHLNLAMCYVKLLDSDNAEIQCDLALTLDPNNEKGLFRRGQARMIRNDFELAAADFSAVLTIDPQNKAAKNQQTIALHKQKQFKDKQKRIYGGMFSKFAEIDAKMQKTEDTSKKKKVPTATLR